MGLGWIDWRCHRSELGDPNCGRCALAALGSRAGVSLMCPNFLLVNEIHRQTTITTLDPARAPPTRVKLAALAQVCGPRHCKVENQGAPNCSQECWGNVRGGGRRRPIC
jgi:hypothetical protein